jgi:hypothetical protein
MRPSVRPMAPMSPLAASPCPPAAASAAFAGPPASTVTRPPAMAMKPDKSRPAEKARPSPDSTTARTDVSRASRALASTKATNMSPSRAFSLSGRLSRTSATPSVICTVTRSDIGTSLVVADHSAPRRSGARHACGSVTQAGRRRPRPPPSPP